MATQVYQEKLQQETIEVVVDFLSRLSLGETIATAAAACVVYNGIDPLASTMLIGSPVISGTLVSQKVAAGIAGNIYMLSLSIRSSANNILINEIKIAIKSSTATIPA